MDSFQFFHANTKTDLIATPPNNRLDALRWMLGISVKNQYLVRLLRKHVILGGNRMIIWTSEPITRMNVELICTLCGISSVSIRAGIKNRTRVLNELAFNTNPDVQVAIMSSRSATESANMQHGGHLHVFMDLIPITSILQAIGRTHRIGQMFEQFIWILTTDETVDQALQQMYQSRFMQQIAATADVPQTMIDKYIANASNSERIEMQKSAANLGRTVKDIAASVLRAPLAGAVMRQLLGIRSPRTDDSWGDLRHLDRKNLQPVEEIFRFTCGGALADELNLQKTVAIKSTEEKKKSRPIHPDEREELQLDASSATQLSPFGALHIFREDAPPIEDSQQVAIWMLHAAQQLALEPLSIMEGRKPLGMLPKDLPIGRICQLAEFVAFNP